MREMSFLKLWPPVAEVIYIFFYNAPLAPVYRVLRCEVYEYIAMN